MVLVSGRTDLREGPRRIREAGQARFDEDGRLVLLGIAVLVAILSLAALTAVTVHRRDAALQAGRAAAGRLEGGGQDSRLYHDLVRAQQDQVTLFQEQVYAPVQGEPGAAQAASGSDPAKDLDRAETDLAAISGQFGDSLQIQRDATQIFRELVSYNGLDGRAQADGQHGLPVGAGYLREASDYLTAPTLGQAVDIRRADQEQVSAADAHAAALPWPLFIADALVLAGLAGAQIVTARYARRRLNPGLVLATVALIILVAWSTTALAVSLHRAGSDAAPHAQAAAALAKAQLYGIQDHTEDLLSLADQGEDCTSPGTNFVSCTFEGAVVSSLTSAREPSLRAALAAAGQAAPDPATRTRVTRATVAADGWLKAEKTLPTLQNLAADAPGGKPNRRYNHRFLNTTLGPYVKPDLRHNGSVVSQDSDRLQSLVQAAGEHEWRSYETQARVAGGVLGALVAGSVLLGLLAAAAAAAGIAWRVGEYWSAGRSTS